jgi:hypothetical protein
MIAQRSLLIGAGLLVLMCPAAAAPAPPPAWSVYADCSAAYLANARLADPDRSASMTAQISEVAKDYAAAARSRYAEAWKVIPATARRAVEVHIARRAKAFGKQPREAVEHIIDACPQVGG